MHELIEFCDESWTINIFDSFLYTFLRAEVYFLEIRFQWFKLFTFYWFYKIKTSDWNL